MLEGQLPSNGRRSSGIRGASVKVEWRPSAVGMRVWNAEEKWKARGWGLTFGAKHDNQYVLRGMMWAGNHWLSCHNNDRLVCMVNDIIEE